MSSLNYRDACYVLKLDLVKTFYFCVLIETCVCHFGR